MELGWGLPRPAMGWGPGGAVRTEARDWVLREKKVKSESINHSVVSDSATPWTTVCQAPLSMEFSRQEYWSG